MKFKLLLIIIICLITFVIEANDDSYDKALEYFNNKKYEKSRLGVTHIIRYIKRGD